MLQTLVHLPKVRYVNLTIEVRQYLPEFILPVTSANCKSLTTLLPLCWDRAEADDPLFTSDEPASLRLINILLPSRHSKLGFPRIQTITSLVELSSQSDLKPMRLIMLQNINLKSRILDNAYLITRKRQVHNIINNLVPDHYIDQFILLISQ